MSNPHQVTRDFERELCAYTGAPFAVAVNSCTAALMLAVAWCLRTRYGNGRFITVTEDIRVSIPRRTYVSVPMAIIHAGGRPVFDDREWLGFYRLAPLPVWDCARFFTGGMYPMHAENAERHHMFCLSFHASKTLGIEQGGAILHDNPEADAWFRRARFDGRAEGVAPKDDDGLIVGWHVYMNPSTAAQGLLKLHSLPRHNEPLPNDDYPDLSQLRCFR